MRAVTVAEALRVGVQIAGAVETAHRAGVLHRDIKPANILVTAYNRPALTDFGIATTTGEEAAAHVRELFAGFDVEVTDLAEGARPGLTHPVAAAFVAAVGAEPRPKYGWTDVARFAALGIPAVNYGPGDPALAHADDERVPLEQIERCERGLRAWLTGA